MQENTEIIRLAAAPEMVRYLALFHRAFGVTAGYKEDRNPNEALLGGYLANALHNLPGILRNYDEDRWNNPGDIERWAKRGMPKMIAGYGAPEAVISLCSRVVSPEGTAAELGLSDDLSDLNLAPSDAFDYYLTQFYYTFLTVRMLRNHGNKGDTSLPSQGRRYSPWHDLRQNWTDRADEKAMLCACIAQALLPVIAGLVRWNTFEEDLWLQEARLAKASVPERFHNAWEAQLKPWVFSANLPSPVV